MDLEQFEKRKKDHIGLAMDSKNQALGQSDLDKVYLDHEALPDLNFDEISIESRYFGKTLKTPFYINSMTAGHTQAVELNTMMARLCEQQGWMMGVGSQRRELSESSSEWKRLRKAAPRTVILGNLGISQLISSKIEDIERLVESVEAQGMFIHLNILQECIQPEGTPQFKGGLKAIEKLCRKLSVPVVIKETGCGMSPKTLKNFKNIGVYAVDVSGLGGTHWGRIEGNRSEASSLQAACAKTFQNWGISTVQSVMNAIKLKPDYQVWASGGVRSGLDAAKLIGLGAKAVGYAQPALQKAIESEGDLLNWMNTQEYELKVAMICTGTKELKNLKAQV
jgi:isopentenyl-diphosphate delta-isomerase